jgi:hypothetical protein
MTKRSATGVCRYLAEGIEGLKDRPMPGAPPKITKAYSEQLAASRPTATAQPGAAVPDVDAAADGGVSGRTTGIRASDETVRKLLKDGEIVLSRQQHKITRPDPEYLVKKTIEETRDGLKAGEAFYYADTGNLSWFPTLRAMWSPKGRHVMIPTPGQPDKTMGSGR